MFLTNRFEMASSHVVKNSRPRLKVYGHGISNRNTIHDSTHSSTMFDTIRSFSELTACVATATNGYCAPHFPEHMVAPSKDDGYVEPSVNGWRPETGE